MSLISAFKTFVSGDVLTAADLNSSLSTIINDYNGSISNANIASNAAITASKISDTALTTTATQSPTNKTFDTTNVVKTPMARVYNSADISISNATVTILTFNSERFDTNTIHDTSSNTSRLTCKTAGIYLIFGSVAWSNGALGVRQVSILLNGATVIAKQLSPANDANNTTEQSISTAYELTVNDYVELQVFHGQGSNLNISVLGNYSPEFGMVRVAPVSTSA